MEAADKRDEFKGLMRAMDWNARETAKRLKIGESNVSRYLSLDNPLEIPDGRLDHLRTLVVQALGHSKPPSLVAVNDIAPKPGETRKNAGIKARKPQDIPMRDVPIVSYAAAGMGSDYSDLAGQIDDWIVCEVRDENAYATAVTGDSMEPELYEGDLVIAAPNSYAASGDTVIARVSESGSVYVKRLRRAGHDGKTIRLESVNTKYSPIEMPESDFRFIHPVIEQRRRYLRRK
jgi:SOS-response transcriptional repressor LexA